MWGGEGGSSEPPEPPLYPPLVPCKNLSDCVNVEATLNHCMAQSEIVGFRPS